MKVLPNSKVVANQADEVYLRVGDKSKKLNFEQRLQLVYQDGETIAETAKHLNLTNHAVRGTLERIRRKNREAALDTFSRHVYTNEVDMRRLNEPEGS